MLAIFFIRDGRQPYGAANVGIGADGNMGHGVACRSAVPMLNIRRTFNDSAFFNNSDGFALFLVEPPTFGNEQDLPALMVMPIGSCSGSECHRADIDVVGAICLDEVVEPYFACEIVVGNLFSSRKAMLCTLVFDICLRRAV